MSLHRFQLWRALRKKKMETSYKITLGLHITSGFLALLCGCVAVISKKGGKIHRGAGKVFFFSMLGVCFTSVFISIVKDNRFLLLIGVFSFYLNYAGYRAIKNKNLKPSVPDWIVLFIAAANTFFMVYSMNVILMVFGAICFYIIIQNLRTNIKTIRNQSLPALAWLKWHIGMMMGAFIATATAFLVVNLGSWKFITLPEWLGWLIPTIALTPLSVYFSRKYTAGRV